MSETDKQEQEIDELLSALEKCIEKPGNAKLACHLSRKLVVAALVSEPDIWTPQREERAETLLEKTAQYTHGTKFGPNCANRPQAFADALKQLRSEEEAWAPLREWAQSASATAQAIPRD